MEKIKSTIASNLSIFAGVCVLVIGFMLLTAGGNDTLAQSGSNSEVLNRAELIETMSVNSKVSSYMIKATGRLTPQSQLQVVGEVAGKITYINPSFKVGGRIAGGDILFKINPTTYEADLANAEAAHASSLAQLAKVKADHARAQDLFDKGHVSEAVVDTADANLAAAEAGVKQASAQIQLAQERLSKTVIRAPFEALVVSETVSKDSFVSPGQVLADLMNTDRAEIAISLKSDEVMAVARTYEAKGKKPISVVAKPGNGAVGSQEIKGHITRIAPVVDPRSRTAVIIAEFDDVFSPENMGRVFGNDFMSVEIEASSTEPLWEIPYGIIRKGAYVWLVGDDNKIHQQPIRVLATSGSKAVVTSEKSLDGQALMVTLLAEEFSGKPVRVAGSADQ
ncbi:RND superfamily efflux pump MFP component [Kordiimonas sediminis]|uniref:RND superfamily efflux pump MFP component n=1 Tax=Kordiimonas sediminis TaxID=1735581 RepID=A0A919APV4_9PROT|nr:efflux RND transporter periplasmic adaptor subunit [Kordiimonas sediminis]GHF17447.1 RND superfamily efflux pump MFP component [Kordiimonas sediminis]